MMYYGRYVYTQQKCTGHTFVKADCGEKKRKRKVYAVRRYNGSLCTQKQPETAAFRALKAATRKGKQTDPKGGQPLL